MLKYIVHDNIEMNVQMVWSILSIHTYICIYIYIHCIYMYIYIYIYYNTFLYSNLMDKVATDQKWPSMVLLAEHDFYWTTLTTNKLFVGVMYKMHGLVYIQVLLTCISYINPGKKKYSFPLFMATNAPRPISLSKLKPNFEWFP